MWLHCMKPFTGKLYSVQVDPNEIPGIEAMGVANYQSLNDIPDDIDYVLCAVPRPVAARIVADCATKKVGVGRAVHVRVRGDRDRGGRPGAGAGHEDRPRQRPDADRPELHGHLQPPARRPAQRGPASGRRRQRRLHQPERHALHQLLARRRGQRDQVLEDRQLRQRGHPRRAGLHRLPRGRTPRPRSSRCTSRA